jgi:hypothetical protein
MQDLRVLVACGQSIIDTGRCAAAAATGRMATATSSA